MYYAHITRTYCHQDPETEDFENKCSIAVGDQARLWLAELITTWDGKWEITSQDFGHPEAGNHEIVGTRVWDQNEDPDAFPITFRIVTGG